MNQSTIDEATANVLLSFQEVTVLLKSDGKVIGRFVPGGLTDEEVYARAHEFMDFDEARRRKAAPRGKGLTTEEVLARLHALEGK